LRGRSLEMDSAKNDSQKDIQRKLEVRMATIKERVEAGAEFLDFIYGDEWRRKIDLESLDLASSRSCILGQTDSDFDKHAKRLHLDVDDVYQFGFVRFNEDSLFHNSSSYYSLTKAWKKYLS